VCVCVCVIMMLKFRCLSNLNKSFLSILYLIRYYYIIIILYYNLILL